MEGTVPRTRLGALPIAARPARAGGLGALRDLLGGLPPDSEIAFPVIMNLGPELKSMNEECRTTSAKLQTSRESMQSVNEELRVVNSELRAKVQELRIVNSELRTKVEELWCAQSDLESLIAATDIGTLFLDRDLKINWFTPRIQELLNVRSRDRGRPLRDLTGRLTCDGLVEDAKHVLRTLEPIERQTCMGRDVWFLVRLRPFGSVENVIQGVVITFADITEQKRAEDKIRELASTLTMAEQSERRRVAAVLHDDLQQRLYGIKMKTSFALEELDEGSLVKTREYLESAQNWMETAIDVTRHVAAELSPPVLKEEGVRSAVEWLASQMDELHGLHVELRADDEFVVSGEDMRVLLFQVVRELLFNVVKHAGVDRAVVEMVRENEFVCISVRDHGLGFDAAAFRSEQGRSAGFGLDGAQERLRLFGGSLEVRSRPEEGTFAVVRAPLTVPHPGA